jgi:hypothetical protein
MQILPLTHMSICELLSIKNDMRYRVSNITPGLYLCACAPTPDSDVISQVAALLGNPSSSENRRPSSYVLTPNSDREIGQGDAQLSADDLD